MERAQSRLQAPPLVAPSPPPETVDDESIDLLGYWRIIVRRKWNILALAVIVTLMATLIALAQEPIYEATATLMIEPGKRPGFSPVQQGEAAGGVYTDHEIYLATQANLVQSRALATDVVERLALYKHPLFDPNQHGPSGVSRLLDLGDQLITQVERVVSGWLAGSADTERQEEPSPSAEGQASKEGGPTDEGKSAEEAQPAEEGVASEEEERPSEEVIKIKKAAAGVVQGSVMAKVGKNSQILTINFDSPDAVLAARGANAYADALIEWGLETRMETAKQAASWLNRHLGGVRQKVQESEEQLQAFRDEQGLIDIEGTSDLSDKQLQDMSKRLLDAQAQRDEVENLFNQVKRLAKTSPADLANHPAMAKNPLIAQFRAREVEAERRVSELAARYGSEHPKMTAAKSDLASARASLRTEMQNTIEGIGKEARVASSTVDRLQRAVDRLKGAVREANRKGFNLRVLTRDVETSRQLYDAFLTRFKETNLAADLESTNARIVDRAEVPTVPVKPRVRLVATSAFVLALMLGIGLALLLERLDNTLKTGDEVEDKLGLPMLGTLPLVRGKGKEKPVAERLFVDDGRSSFAEAMRTIRTGVVLSGLDDPHKVVLVTSTLPAEGKTTVSANLALSLGQLERVLLVDADMRHASIGTKFGLPKDGPGLSNLVAGTATDEECIHAVADVGIHVLPAGVIPPNPQELLSSNRFADLIERLSGRYDRIVLDSAPAQAVSDALVLSSLCNAVVYVIRADSTPYPLAQAGIKRLLQVGAPLVGAVLNLQDPEKASRYGRYGGYGRYGRYSYYYDRYYQHDYYGEKAS